MKGRVYVEYRRLGFFAVETADDDFSIIEVRNGLPSLEDELIGELNSLGEQQLYNETTKEELDVSIKFIHATLAEAKNYIKGAIRGK
ncbi:hypothetical protein [Paenibacillus gallinarum]|uniref:Uncharacterized protein n=1 Tax=Paenibacillus gallinarum TaxID=2762232 RepID=A0ABR8SYK0_9BACL|nr:hypothetical protein [Paenibacillus gallinarum]MBD7968587.1 hypothetical protein [Paenibacillus gallinarum]